MENTPRGVRSISERVLKNGRALIVTNEDYDEYDFKALPEGTLHVDIDTGVVTVKLRGQTTFSPATFAITNDVEVPNPTMIISRDTQLNEEVFKIISVDAAHEIFMYEIVDENKPETEWVKRQKPVLDNGRHFIFELEEGEYLGGRNHLEVSVDGVLTRTVMNGGIKEISEKRFAVVDELIAGQTIIVRYVKWMRIGNPYPRFFLNNGEPESAQNGDFWLDYNGNIEEGDAAFELMKNPTSTVNWSQIINKPNTITGYNITDAAYKNHIHKADSIEGIGDFVRTIATNTTVENAASAAEAVEAEHAKKADVADKAITVGENGYKIGNGPNSVPVLDANGKLYDNALINKFMFVQNTAPASGMVKGAFWFNESNGCLYVYNGSAWIGTGAVWK